MATSNGESEPSSRGRGSKLRSSTKASGRRSSVASLGSSDWMYSSGLTPF